MRTFQIYLWFQIRNIFFLLNTINCSFPYAELGTQVVFRRKKHRKNEQQHFFFHKFQIETTELHLIQHSILLNAKGLFLINNGTFLRVIYTIIYLTESYTHHTILFSACERYCGLYDNVFPI